MYTTAEDINTVEEECTAYDRKSCDKKPIYV
jgi:hypothetical protein